MLRKRNIISIILFWVILIVLYEMISIVFSVNDSPSQMNVQGFFIGGKTFVVTYQEKDFYSNDSHNLALYFKNNKTKLNQLYLATCINKSLGHKYSWGNSISKAKIQADKVSLPTKDNQPYYALMETFISAVQKLVIKDVVLYVNKKKGLN
jgi:hypothetical protein